MRGNLDNSHPGALPSAVKTMLDSYKKCILPAHFPDCPRLISHLPDFPYPRPLGFLSQGEKKPLHSRPHEGAVGSEGSKCPPCTRHTDCYLE